MIVSIVIPNFNGENLLPKNLPNILDAGADEVIVLDDASTDKSVEILSKFKTQNSKLKILEHEKNQGFINSVNELFKEAKGDIIVLLNNDVWVEKNFLKPLISHFNNDKVFAVNLHEEGEGPAISFWKDGFYEFKRGEEKDVIQKSAWASGGSAAFRKSIWKKLGGFDPLFSPFYFEDTDISFRAIKAGFEVLWESQSHVKHEHETTIKKTFSQRYINWIQQRNHLLFIWKNITDSILVRAHKKGLLKRLSKVGYWIPYLWAVWKSLTMKREVKGERSDLESINYMQEIKLSVVTVTYNNEDSIREYVTSVLKFLPENGELVILDNASNDETVKILEKFGDQIKLIKSSENLGFSKGNNRAVKETVGEYLFFLNPDTEILEESIDKLIRCAEDKDDLGIVAPQLIEEDGSIQPSVRKLPTLIGAIKEYLLHEENSFEQYVPSEKNAVEVECVYGGAMLIRRDIFETLNGFDERYFLYYEDIDLCKRLKEHGLKIIYYPDVKIHHSVGGSVTKIDKLPWGIRTLVWFFPLKKYGSRYHQARGSNIYHGFLKSFLISLIIYLAVKLRIYKPKEVITF